MLKGKELLDYTVNLINSEDKFIAIYTLADELVDLGDNIARRAISLLNPLTQYSFLETIILEDKDCDTKLVEYLKSMKYPLPVKYGWREVTIKSDGTETEVDKVEWYDDKHTCYWNMFRNAMEGIKNAVDCMEDISIKRKDSCIIICADGVQDMFQMYEMD